MMLGCGVDEVKVLEGMVYAIKICECRVYTGEVSGLPTSQGARSSRFLKTVAVVQFLQSLPASALPSSSFFITLEHRVG